MGNWFDKYEDEARVQVEEQNVADQQRRQAEELSRRREAFEQERRDWAEQKKLDLERQAEEVRRADEQAQKLMDSERKNRADEQAREEQLRAEQDKQLTRTMEEGVAAKDRQREQNASEMARMITDHRNEIVRTTEQGQRTETRVAEQVMDLKKQKAEQAEKLHSELETFTERKIAEDKEHKARIESLTAEQVEIKLEGKRNKLEHTKTLQGMKESFAAQEKDVLLAGVQDEKESHFVDAVDQVNSIGLQLSSLVPRTIKIETYIENKMPIPATVINQCISNRKDALPKLHVLKDCAIAMRNQRESNNASSAECQTTALRILEIAGDLEQELNHFDAFLVENLSPEYWENALKTSQEIKNLNKQLFDAINHMPVVQKTYYVRLECSKRIDMILTAGTTVRGSDVSPGEILGEPSSEVVEEEVE